MMLFKKATLWSALIFGVFSFSVLTLPAQTASASTSISQSALLSSINQIRANSGVSKLSLNSALGSAAVQKASHMAKYDYWDHTGPDGSTAMTFVSRTNYSYKSLGENLAYGFSTSSGVIDGWMASSSHRSIIMTAHYRDIGFGVLYAADFQGGPNTIVVAIFGQPTQAAPVAAAKTVPTNSAAQTKLTLKILPAPDPAPTPVVVAEPKVAKVKAEQAQTTQAVGLEVEDVASSAGAISALAFAGTVLAYGFLGGVATKPMKFS